MGEDISIKTFNDKNIRTKWDKEIGDYYYSLIDVMEALTGSGNPERYWTLLKASLSKDSNVLARMCIQLNMSSNKDKSYFTDVATTNNLITILDNINCDKKDEFIRWLNQTRLQHLYDLNGTSYLLLYHGDEGTLFVESIFDGVNDTLWATQKAIAEFFDVSKQSISSHFKDIFKVCELEKESVVSQIKMTASNGRKYKTNLYILDAIMTVCYRINSDKSITFRKWATNRLKEYIVKGFILDEELLENGTIFNIDYFDYLLELIQQIQISNRRFDQKIADLYATSYDYNKNSEITRNFYATLQNKLIYAVTRKTPAEIIFSKNDNQESRIELTDYLESNEERALANHIISKNFLDEQEVLKLDVLVDE